MENNSRDYKVMPPEAFDYYIGEKLSIYDVNPDNKFRLVASFMTSQLEEVETIIFPVTFLDIANLAGSMKLKTYIHDSCHEGVNSELAISSFVRLDDSLWVPEQTDKTLRRTSDEGLSLYALKGCIIRAD